MDLPGRLRQARLDAGFNTMVEFHMALPKGVRGSSYSSIRSYERGITDPPDEFLQAAAPVLGVTLQWLTEGRGSQTTGQAEAHLHREEQRKNPVSEKLWELTNEVLDAYTQIPGPGLRLLQDLIFDLYYQRGPEAFGVAYEGPWEGYVSAREAWPEILVSAADIHAYLEERLGSVLFDTPVASYGEHVAQWLSAFAVLYLQEFGSRR